MITTNIKFRRPAFLSWSWSQSIEYQKSSLILIEIVWEYFLEKSKSNKTWNWEYGYYDERQWSEALNNEQDVNVINIKAMNTKIVQIK